MAKGFENEGQTTGVWDDNSAISYWDPEQQKIVHKGVGDGNARDLINDLGLGHYQNSQGDFVYGMRPEEIRYNDTGEFMTTNPDMWPTFPDFGDREFSLGDPADSEGRYSDRPDYNAPFEPPTTTKPTDPFDPVGGPTVPWEGQGKDQSWKWDYFQPKSVGAGEWGGYDQDYQAFERYQPGMDSPWGMPDIEGGNRDFYQQQFVNQLRDEQGYQNRERAAQMRRQEALESPAGNPNYADMWASMGITPSQAAQYDDDGAYQWNFKAGLGDVNAGQTTNYEMYNRISDNLPVETQRIMGEYFNNEGSRDGTRWGWSPDAQTLIGEIGQNGDEISGEFRNALTDVYNGLYSRADLTTPVGGGPTAAAGYASPI